LELLLAIGKEQNGFSSGGNPTVGFGLMAIIISMVRMRSCGEPENGMRDTTGHVSNPMKWALSLFL